MGLALRPRIYTFVYVIGFCYVASCLCAFLGCSVVTAIAHNLPYIHTNAEFPRNLSFARNTAFLCKEIEWNFRSECVLKVWFRIAHTRQC